MNEATAQVRKVWEDRADAWYAQRESLLAKSRPMHEWLVAHVRPKPGQQLLEIAAGPGDTGFLAAARLGSGRLLSTDIAPGMVDAARKRGAELDITNVDYRVLDAQAMDLPDASFNGVICRWGFMLMPDPAAAFRECRRVLEPGGRLAFAVFAGPDDNPWASVPAGVLREMGHAPQPTGAWQPGIFALADLGRLQALLDEAAFTTTEIEPVEMTWTFASPDEYWTFLVDVSALGPVVRGMDEQARDEVRERIDARLPDFTRPDGIVLPARCWGGLAIR